MPNLLATAPFLKRLDANHLLTFCHLSCFDCFGLSCGLDEAQHLLCFNPFLRSVEQGQPAAGSFGRIVGRFKCLLVTMKSSQVVACRLSVLLLGLCRDESTHAVLVAHKTGRTSRTSAVGKGWATWGRARRTGWILRRSQVNRNHSPGALDVNRGGLLEQSHERFEGHRDGRQRESSSLLNQSTLSPICFKA